MSPPAAPVYALVLAGGRGTRFWPLSRKSRPKQCIALTGGDTLLQQTVARIAPLVPSSRVLVLTGPDMVELVRAQLPELPPENILVEPRGRGTAPCLGWGAVEVRRRGGPDAVMIALPADHVVGEPATLVEALGSAAAAARDTGALVTLGIRPSRPETGYGYLRRGGSGGIYLQHELFNVEKFVEKPDLSTAQRYLDEGNYLWNAGMFVFTAAALLDAFRAHLPRSADALDAIAANPDALDHRWADLDATSIDYGVMERHRHTLVLPVSPDWSDVGAWPEAAARWPEVEGGRGVAEAVVARDASENAVFAPGQAVALLGVHDLVVVSTPDALLVMDRARAQDLRGVVDALEAKDLGRFL